MNAPTQAPSKKLSNERVAELIDDRRRYVAFIESGDHPDLAEALEMGRDMLAALQQLQRAENEPPAVPTWTCINCDVVDEFSVKHEVVDDSGAVLSVVECHNCGHRHSHEVEANTPRIDLKPTPPASDEVENLRFAHRRIRDTCGNEDPHGGTRAAEIAAVALLPTLTKGANDER